MKTRKSKQNNTLVLKFTGLFNKDYRLITAVLILLPLLIYAQVYNFEFVWDDNAQPLGHFNNGFVSKPSLTAFIQLFSQPFYGMYIPISYLSLGILKALAELLSLPVNSVLHLSNVVVHIVNGLLVFTILRQFVVSKWAALIGVLLFLLHPIQVEAVAWVSEFRGLLATLFSLTALYFYLKNQTKLRFLSLFLFILALLSKPSAVSLVLFVFAINHFHYGFKWGKNIQKTIPYALIALIFVLIAHSIQNPAGFGFIYQHSIAFWQLPFAWLDSIVFYLWQLIYPYHLSASYTLSPKFISTQWWFYPLALMPLILGTLLWLKRKSQPMIVFAAVLFIAGFFTTSGFVDFAFQKLSLVADRYLYFAMIGVALFVAILVDNSKKKYWQGLILGILVVFMTLSAFRQIPIWQNSLTLWTHSINYEINPRYAHGNLGNHFEEKGMVALKAKEYKESLIYFDKAIGYYLKDLNNKNLGHIFYKKAWSLSIQGKYQQAEVYFDKSIAFFSQNPDSVKNPSKSFYSRGVARFKQNKLKLALQDFSKTIELNSKHTKARSDKIYIHLLLKQCKKANQTKQSAYQNQIKIPQPLLKQLKSQCPLLKSLK